MSKIVEQANMQWIVAVFVVVGSDGNQMTVNA